MRRGSGRRGGGGYKPSNRLHIQTFLSVIGEDATKAAQDALKEGAEMIAARARELAPVHSGNLRNSIHTRQSEGKSWRMEVVADAQNEYGVCYAKYVEFSPKINKPFMYPAADELRKKINIQIAASVLVALEEHSV